MSVRAIAVTTVATLGVAVSAQASPKVGTSRPNIVVSDAWERTFDFSTVGSRPLLVLYEDKDSANQNKALKDELAQVAKGDAYKDKAVLLAFADVTGWNYWPARGYVKDAIKEESRKANTPIFCDWDGTVQRSLAVKRGTSNVFLYSREGKVIFSYEGPMPEASRKELLELLRAQLT
jgi:hypothetical protein